MYSAEDIITLKIFIQSYVDKNNLLYLIYRYSAFSVILPQKILFFAGYKKEMGIFYYVHAAGDNLSNSPNSTNSNSNINTTPGPETNPPPGINSNPGPPLF